MRQGREGGPVPRHRNPMSGRLCQPGRRRKLSPFPEVRKEYKSPPQEATSPIDFLSFPDALRLDWLFPISVFEHHHAGILDKQRDPGELAAV